ncbi:DUF2303 family protein [Polycladidibacter hongkongensis]|uniref:DUF2303 family protein n=1 Tax=Polycladidibacter hongkongensis TaxID=1647556 RepID=UPI000835A917|nr:DUF2303 family protein [Pseudovibrio hongkongensis]
MTNLATALEKLSQMSGQAHNPEIVRVKHPHFGNEITQLVLRDGDGGMQAIDLTKALERYDRHPLRRTGTMQALSLESLIEFTQRNMEENSAMFADNRSDQLSLTTVFNYNDPVNRDTCSAPAATAEDEISLPAGGVSLPQWGDHRTRYAFPLSREWNIWRAAEREKMDMIEFSHFLEDNITDVMPLPTFLLPGAAADLDNLSEPDKNLRQLIIQLESRPCGPDKLMTLAKGLQVHDQQKAKVAYNRSTGEQQLVFEEQHTDAEGKPLAVPNLFLISIPVFEGEQSYRIPVRLRYRTIRGGGIYWLLSLHRPDRCLEHAFNEACATAACATGLPLFYGTPE